jgi:putative hemolysin
MLEIVGIILLLIVAHGVLTSAELAVASTRSGRLQHFADQGHKGAAAALRLREDPERFLSTVQLGITVIGTLASVLGGMRLTAFVSARLAVYPWLAPYADVLAFVLVVGILSYLLLVVGELVPKRLAVQSPEAIAMGQARLLQGIITFSRPMRVLLGWSTEAILALMGRRNMAEASVTEEDIRELVHEGAQEGSVEPQEEQIIAGVFRLGSRTVRQIMTPRIDIFALDGRTRIADVLDMVIDVGYSRYPVYQDNPDELVGVVHLRNLLQEYRARGELALVQDVMFPPTLVPENARASTLLTTFRKNQRHLAIVVSELGSVEGVVTLEDVLEEIVGDILDESDEYEAQAITVRDDGSLLIDGNLPIDLLKERLEIDELPDESFYQYDTLAGFMLSQIGRIPDAGESLTWNNWRFEVMDMDGLRIDKVLASYKEPEPEEEETTS